MEAFFTKDIKTVKELSEKGIYNNVVEIYSKSGSINEADTKKAVLAAMELPFDIYYINDSSVIVQFKNRQQGVKGIIKVCIRNVGVGWLVYDADFSTTGISVKM